MATNLQIYIDGQLADYEESEAFPLVFSERGVNISNVTEKAGNASFTVEFPLTDNNKKIFKHKENLTVSNKFNVTKDTQAEVYIGDSLVFQGAFRILQITANKLQGFFMVSDAVWFNDLAGKSMRDLKIKEIAFTGHSASGLNMEYVMENKTRADYPAEHPLVCYGGFYNSGENGLNLQNILTSDFMNFQDLPPHLYLKEVLQKMFTDVNWQVTGDILNPDRENWIISKGGKDESFWNWNVLGNVKFSLNSGANISFNPTTGAGTNDYYKGYGIGSCEFAPLTPTIESIAIKYVNTADCTITNNLGLLFVAETLHIPIDGIYDIIGYNPDISGSFTLGGTTLTPTCRPVNVSTTSEQLGGYLIIKDAYTDEEIADIIQTAMTSDINNTNWNLDVYFNMTFTDNGSGGWGGEWVNRRRLFGSDLELIYGDGIKIVKYIYYNAEAINSTITLDLYHSANQYTEFKPFSTESQNCILNYDTNEYVPAYTTLEIGRSLPNLSQQDFIRGLMNMFNLYTNVDLDRRIIDFKTGESFYKNGYYYNDITEFCDIRSYEITPKGMPKTFELNYINDEADRNDDNLDIKTKQTNKTVYAEKENIIQLPFSLTKMGRFQDFLSTDYFNAPFIYNPDFTNQSLWSTAFNYQPRFFNYLGTSGIYSAFRAGAYQPPILLVDIPNIGSSVLYSTYYAPLFGDYDTKEAVEIMVLLDIEKYKRLRLDIPVMIDGVLYNIEAKENFAPLKNGLTKIKLIRK